MKNCERERGSWEDRVDIENSLEEELVQNSTGQSGITARCPRLCTMQADNEPFEEFIGPEFDTFCSQTLPKCSRELDSVKKRLSAALALNKDICPPLPADHGQTGNNRLVPSVRASSSSEDRSQSASPMGSSLTVQMNQSYYMATASEDYCNTVLGEKEKEKSAISTESARSSEERDPPPEGPPPQQKATTVFGKLESTLKRRKKKHRRNSPSRHTVDVEPGWWLKRFGSGRKPQPAPAEWDSGESSRNSEEKRRSPRRSFPLFSQPLAAGKALREKLKDKLGSPLRASSEPKECCSTIYEDEAKTGLKSNFSPKAHKKPVFPSVNEYCGASVPLSARVTASERREFEFEAAAKPVLNAQSVIEPKETGDTWSLGSKRQPSESDSSNQKEGSTTPNARLRSENVLSRGLVHSSSESGIFSAAVADFRPKLASEGKIRQRISSGSKIQTFV